MKFGKQLECLSLPKYRGYYIQYKELKKALKVWTGLEKDQSTVQEVTHWASSFLRLGPNPETSPEHRLHAMLRHEMERISKFAELEDGSLRTQLSRLEQDCQKSDADRCTLSKRLDELGEQLVQLKSFAQLNFTGFRKILKKYDKWSASKALVTPWFMTEVVRAPFMNVNYEVHLEQINRIAIAIRGIPGSVEDISPPSRSRILSGGFENTLQSGREVAFFVDPKDTMQVRMLFAKHLLREKMPPTTPEVAQQRRRTTVVFMETADLAVYSAHIVGVPSGEAEGGMFPTHPCTSLHLRHSDGEAAMLVYEKQGEAARTEVLIARAEAAKFLKGQAAMPASPGSLLADAVSAVEGLIPPADPTAARAAMSAMQAGITRQRTVAQVSYVRSVFEDQVGGFRVVLDEEMRMAEVTEPLMTTGVTWQHFPRTILTISSTSAAQLGDGPKWFRLINDSTNLVQVSGFSKAAHVVAHFCARDSGLPEPHWYRNIMNSISNEPGSGEVSEVQSVRSSVALDQGSAISVPASHPAPSPASARLLHEFGTTPAEEANLTSRLVEEASTPAADTGSLSAPLLAGSSTTATGLTALPPAGSGSSPSGGLLKRLARTLGLARGTAEGEAVGSQPVRNAIVAVQPKTLFSNERTFLEWMHFATILASAGVVMMHSTSVRETIAVGRFLVLSAIFLIGWSLHTFNWRADALDHKDIIDYKDPIGPPAVVIALLAALGFSTAHALLTAP
mmetsp:Transcript_137335/g.342460  ORF Transcript_137335/g.342460 Transcript_137335/m.342460 type:complete len:734 (-) Transcript_137335:208-2409(-)|eukprot:CAMPEP_0115304888 /NCGR_PEP_ID=MMETSP0270-20121206/71712_1 /TAXON_ID=71861 /ORGANISM="Scrippsiella trochoidea, Strain CCMP3099" /LENGTH=733 /DNA_ID=CAMNT_0002723023 /DNA_START=65 /DNA_END=2266 /DNA_ORIENTATION=-